MNVDGTLTSNGDVILFQSEASINFIGPNENIPICVTFKSVKTPKECKCINVYDLEKKPHLAEAFYLAVNEFKTRKNLMKLASNADMSTHKKMAFIEEYRNIYPPHPVQFTFFNDYLHFLRTKYKEKTGEMLIFFNFDRKLCKKTPEYQL